MDRGDCCVEYTPFGWNYTLEHYINRWQFWPYWFLPYAFGLFPFGKQSICLVLEHIQLFGLNILFLSQSPVLELCNSLEDLEVRVP